MKFYYLLALATASVIGASPLAQVEPEHVETDWIPALRLSRRDVDDMKANLEHPAGSIIGNATFGSHEAGNARTFPVVLVDPEWLLEGKEGDRKRDIARRQGSLVQACMSIAGLSHSCAISYCWYKADNHALVSTHVTITRTPALNPLSTASGRYSITRPSADKNKIDIAFVDESNGRTRAYTWQPHHTCNDETPFVHTVHRIRGSTSPFVNELLSYVDLKNGKAAWAKIGRVNCRTCDFNFWSCAPAFNGEMMIYTNGAGTGTACN